MTEPAVKTYKDFILPPTVVSKLDLSRLVGEFELVDNELTAASIRTKTGAPVHSQPVLSEQLKDFLLENKFQLQTGHDRSELVKELRLLKDNVPTVHMTFAVSADRESLEQLAQWLRTSVHSQAVIDVGLQPALVAGVYLRTPNHVHDLSLKAMLDGQHGLLVKELESLRASN